MRENSERARPEKKRRTERSPSMAEESDDRDLFCLLPDDCLAHILIFLPSPKDRCTCAAVSKRWLLLLAQLAGKDSGTARAPPRFLHGTKATDIRLAAMAVGSTHRGPPTEIHIGASTVSDLGLTAISPACYSLNTLSLWNCPFISDQGLIAIAKNSPKLSYLRLDKCPLITDRSLRAISEFCPSLERITLLNCPRFTNPGFISLFSSLPKLAKIRISGTAIGDGSLAAVAARAKRFPLGFLSLSLCNSSGFSPTGFKLLAMAGNLRSLELRSCKEVDDAFFFFFSGQAFPKLRSLVLSKAKITDQALSRLSKAATELETLELDQCHEVTSEGLMAAIGNLSLSLKSLSLVDCNAVGRAVEGETDTCRRLLLRSVAIKRCARVCDEFLLSLGRKVARLKRVELVGLAGVSDRGFAGLIAAARWGGLRSVELSQCSGISDRSVAAVVHVGAGSLRRLALDGCDGVTDYGLRLVRLFCLGLVELDLSRCGRITDQSLRGLEEMALQGNLSGLSLKNCKGLSAAAVAAIGRALWWCDLIS
ncbi:EIN3-binding F-box protein 1-like [Wolffia australiana]